MAKKVNNDKGFLILQLSKQEIHKLGGGGICDVCSEDCESGFYIAVLNRWYCPSCYENTMSYAEHFEEDIDVEKRNYRRVLNSLNLTLLN